MERSNPYLLVFARVVIGLCLYPFFHLQIRGRENLPQDKAFILLPKHQRWEDIPLLGLATPNTLYYVAKHELFLNPVYKWLISALGGIPLNRKRPIESRRSLKQIIAVLKYGEGLVIFPEGTYYNGHVGPGHVGLIRMVSSRLVLPFVPVGIRYPKGGIRARVQINFGTPIYNDTSVAADKFVSRVMQEIAKLSGLSL